MAHVVHVKTGHSTPDQVVRVVTDQGNSSYVRTGSGSNPHSSYVDSTTGTWWMYDKNTGRYYDTGIQGDGSMLSLSGVSDEFVISEDRVLFVNQIDYSKVSGIEALLDDIPIATTDVLGVVRANDAENGVLVTEDGVMIVGDINVNKLVQTPGERFTLNAGNASD